MSETVLGDYEERARQRLVKWPGSSLAEVTLQLGVSDGRFWEGLVSRLAAVGQSEQSDLLKLTPCNVSYFKALTDLSLSAPDILHRFKHALIDHGYRLAVLRVEETPLYKLCKDFGPTGINQTYRLFKRLREVDSDSGPSLHNLINIPCDEKGTFCEGLGWLERLGQGAVDCIGEHALYRELSHAIAQSLAEQDSAPAWLAHLDAIPMAMRGLTSLELIRVFEVGCAWYAREISDDPLKVQAPIFGQQHSAKELFWQRPYMIYTDDLGSQIKRIAVETACPDEVMGRIIERGLYRIAQNDKPYLGRFIANHLDTFRRTEMDERVLESLKHLGVPGRVLCSHPAATPAFKAAQLRNDLGLDL